MPHPTHIEHETTHPHTEESAPIFLSHYVRVIRRYSAAIVLSLVVIAIGYTVFAMAMYLLKPAQRITTLPFRFNFEGATIGTYPNGVKFTASDLTATPVLLEVFRQNDVGRFMPFGEFSHSLFVLETNPDLERLDATYSARLGDPKLSPIDRDRVEREYDQKRANLAKSAYSVIFSERDGTKKVPKVVVQKILTDVLAEWAHQAAVDRNVLLYSAPVLTANVLDRTVIDHEDNFIALALLSSRLTAVINNIRAIETLPGAQLIRTQKEHESLTEIGLSLQDVAKYRLEPLMISARTGSSNHEQTLEVLEGQLSYDQRMLDEARGVQQAARDALIVYQQGQGQPDHTTAVTAPPRTTTANDEGARQSVTAQVNDSFIDRIAALSTRTADIEYRQRMVESIKAATISVIPMQSAVSFDERLVKVFKDARPVTTNPNDAKAFRDRWLAAFDSVSHAVEQLNEIYQTASKQMNPVSELVTTTGPAVIRTDHSISSAKLMAWGVFVLLFSLPLVVVFCLLHNRVREEVEAEEREEPLVSAAKS